MVKGLERYEAILAGKEKARFLMAKEKNLLDKKVKQCQKVLESAVKYSASPGYPEFAKRNFLLAQKQAELLIRVLIIPGLIESDGKPILEWVAKNLGKDVRINILSQYWPAWQAEKYPEINRRLTPEEYDDVIAFAEKVGLTNIITQPIQGMLFY